ncbi:MAG: glutamate-5-semialdehyde dehydrogenase [Elusimicrobiota bacterium]|jgi:glutamate-5-semialdehyde dehydrogenase|nr:glutamate-5-semialdehyde dehydrogenase [Elusimicrobiota bacterium]
MENNEIKQKIFSQSCLAKSASAKLATLSLQEKNKILALIAESLYVNLKEIIFHNEIDVEAAKTAGLSQSLIDRISLDERKISTIVQGVKDIILLDDPIGSLVETLKPATQISVKKVRVPLGVVSMIYEARPGVTVDAAVLCLKSGNAVILKGGSEALNSNRIIAKIIYSAGLNAGMPEGAIQFIDTSDRLAVQELLRLHGLIDLIIPRGSEDFVNYVKNSSLIPVLSHGKGLCHTYVDKDADIDSALKVAFNAKCQRPSVCNAMETLLVHKDVSQDFLTKICNSYEQAGVEIFACQESLKIIKNGKPATEESWSTEYHDLKISIKIVGSVQEAIEHINKYGSHHSDAIITKNEENAKRFANEVDSSAVLINASTRLHDGSVFGLGCEIGISTQKLHARGAMGLKELTTTKYIVEGNGAVRE